MNKIRIGHSVYFNPNVQSNELLPLLDCLSYAITTNLPLDFFLRGILNGEGQPCGGDPGWSIHWISEADEALFPEDWKRCMALLPAGDNGCYEAWTHQPVSELEPPCAYYAKSVVRHHIREVLGNFQTLHPERAVEVESVIRRFNL